MPNIDLLTSMGIHIGQTILAETLPYITGKQVCIVTQQSIPSKFIKALETLLTHKDIKIMIIPEGESAKSWDMVEFLTDELVNAHFNRECTLIALGGGVVGDITGFVASIYLRGVNFIQIPTTLLAQVDASVGGKTAINHAKGKNLIGSFYQPKAVVIDVDSLKTLPDRDFIAGIAEIIKIACIRDADFFNWLENNVDAILARDSKALIHMINRSVTLKVEIVKADEKEKHERMLLNFGHTIGHAIEAARDYQGLHGEAVAVGMVEEVKLSQEYGLSGEDANRIIQLIQRFGLPTTFPEKFQENWQTYIQQDKKQRDNGMNWVLLKSIGCGAVKLIDSKDEAVVKMALLNVAQRLAIDHRQLSKMIGISESKISGIYNDKQCILAQNNEEYELALLLIHAFRNLDVIVGGNEGNMRIWFHSFNEHLDAIPIELAQKIGGLVAIVNYLDAMRVKL